MQRLKIVPHDISDLLSRYLIHIEQWKAAPDDKVALSYDVTPRHLH